MLNNISSKFLNFSEKTKTIGPETINGFVPVGQIMLNL